MDNKYDQRFAGNKDPFVKPIIINKTTKQDIIKLVGNIPRINLSKEGLVWKYDKMFRPLFGTFGPLMKFEGYNKAPSYVKIVNSKNSF